MIRAFRRLLKRAGDLDQVLAGYEVPSFPDTILRVLTLLRDPESSIGDIAHFLKMDPGAHVRVLTMVNSAALGLAHHVSNIEHAATLLGRARLEALVVSVAVGDALPVVQVAGLDINQFWLYACKRAGAARALAQLLHPGTEIESFAGGLLQDMAVPVMFDYFGERYRAVYQEWLLGQESRLDVLKHMALGVDHSAVGERIAKQWQLGSYLMRAISGHHSFDEAADSDVAVKLVSFIRPAVPDDGVEQLMVYAREQLQLDTSEFESVLIRSMQDASAYFRNIVQ